MVQTFHFSKLFQTASILSVLPIAKKYPVVVYGSMFDNVYISCYVRSHQ